jgi:predicted nucleotidyltransferase
MAERHLRSRLKTKESAMSAGLETSLETLPETSKALKHRREAAACGVFAVNAKSATDRELLLRMQRSLLTRAYHEDWLDGLPPVPPAGCNSLALPARS